MLGFTDQVTVRYIGTYLATGAYVSNWAAITTYQANNITGQWKRVFTAAAVTAMNGAGGIAGSCEYISCPHTHQRDRGSDIKTSHRETTRSTEIYDSRVGVDRLAHTDHRLCSRLYSLLLCCEQETESWEGDTGENGGVQVYILGWCHESKVRC